MNTLSDYESWKAKRQQNNVGAASVVISATDVKPDEVAGDMNLAAEFGKVTGGPQPPLPLVKEYRNVFQQRLEEERNGTILSTSPRLTEWLRNPENAAVSRDDLSGLSWWETPLAAAGNAVGRGVRRIPQSFNQWMASGAAERAADQGRSFGDIYADERARPLFDWGYLGNSGLIDTAVGPITDALAAGSRFATSRLAGLISGDQKEAAVEYQRRAGEIAKRIQEIPMSPAGQGFRTELSKLKPSGDILADLGSFMGTVGSDPGGFVAFLAETAAESAPQLAAAAATAAATRNTGAAAAMLGFGSFSTEAGTAPVEFFNDHGIDVSTPEGALSAVTNPQLWADAQKRGMTRGVIIGIMDGLSGGVAGQQLASSRLGNAALQSVVQAIFGAGGEAAGQIASGQPFSISDVLIEGLAEFVTAPAEVAAVGGERFVEGRRKAQDAEVRRALFQELSGQAVNSKVRARMPDKFREFLAQATADGPIENLYVPAGEFVQYFQGAGIDPRAVVNELEGVTLDDLEAALAGGGDLQIPTATYAAKIAGTEHDAFMMDNMRFDPDAFTAREAAEFNARAQDAMEEAWQVAEDLRRHEEEFRSFEQDIQEEMAARLRRAGRASDVANTEAMLYPAFYRVMAERSGMTTEEFLRQYPLPQVRGSIPEGMQPRDVDALNRTLAEARKRRTARETRPTLLEWISDYGGIDDAGGELRARDAEALKRPGKKTLRLARSGDLATGNLFGGAADGKRFGADSVAAAAVEAGFLSDDPAVTEYQNATLEGREAPDITRALYAAIDRELRGEPQYAGAPDPRIADSATLDSIEEYLSSLGVTLDDSDEKIKEALSQASAGAKYGQFAGVRALNMNGGNLALAQAMTLGGFDRQQVYDATGFFTGPDGKWRFEISDADAAFVRGALIGRAFFEFVPIRQVLKHDRLFAAYPQLSDVKVKIKVAPEASDKGVYRPSENSIYVTASNETEGMSILLHEVAHAIQRVEEFATGGNLSMGEVYEGEHVDAHRAHISELTELLKSAWESNDFASVESIEKRIRDEESALVVSAKFEYYRRIAGEVEARNVQTRYEMAASKEEWKRDLAKDAPWWTADVPDNKVIIVRSEERGEAFEALSAGRSYAQVSDPAPRGSVQFPAGGVGTGETVIRLFEGANLSTMLHETGHYFLTVMQDLALRGDPVAREELLAVKAWWRENAADVAKDALRSNPDVRVTADDVIAALDHGTTGDFTKDRAIDVGMQEQFARGFEAYLMDGKAPNADLRTAFEKFRSWLLSIYRKLAALDVRVTDDVRAVFDRMLASDAELEKAQREAGGAAALFPTAEAMGLSQKDYDAFLKLRDQAESDAKAKLLAEAMAPIRREREKWYREEKERVRVEVERTVNAYGVYRAIEWMGNRRWLGDGQPSDMPDIRLSKDVLVERYGEGVLKTLPRGKQTVYSVEGGLDPDDAAGWFGFGSGDEMVKAMERAQKRTDAIAAETEREMFERHGDALKDGTIEAAALDAVHTDKRGQWLAAELKAVAEVAGMGNMLTAKEARASARDAISRMRVRDAMNANRFLSAERKAGEEAARLGAQLAREKIWLDAAQRRIGSAARAALRGAGEVDTAAKAIEDFNSRVTETTSTTYSVEEQTRTTKDGKPYTIPGGERTSVSLSYNDMVAKLVDAKRRQLINHALYAESRKVAEEVEKAERFVAKLGKRSTRERIAGAGRRDNAGIDYLSAIDELLERYDFRRLSATAEQRRGSLAAFVEAMKAAGRENELAIPDSVLADAARKPYKTVPVEELRGVIDSLKNLEHVALRWNDLIDAQKERQLDAVVTDIVASFDANLPKRPPGRVNTKGEAARNSVRQFFDLVLNASTILREIDGFADFGAAYRNIKSPIDEAMNRLINRKEAAASALEGLYSVYTKAERRRMSVREHVPALGYALSKWERIAVALNTGNAGNLQRLTDSKVRGSLTPAQVQAVLATLDERDAKFVQSVWDYVGSFRADIAAREKRATGVEPQWVEAQPVTIAGQTLRGGYYPIKYDPRLSALARDDQAQEIAQQLQAGRFGKAQTRSGHLKARAESSGRDIELDMAVLHRHINQVVYDLELSEPVANSWRILQDGRVRSAFMEAGKQADFDALEIWLKDVAEGELKSADFVGRAARTLKSNFTAAKLAFNLGTVAVQVSGLAQSFVVVGKRDMATGIAKTIAHPARAAQDIVVKSPFMASRQTTFNKDIYDFYSDPKTGPAASRWGDIKETFVGPLAFWLMTKVQFYAVDVPTWVGGYSKGLRKFGDEAKAIAFADDAVKRAAASGLFSDRSAIERGSVSRTARQNDVVRLFTTLGSYMFAKFNVAYERSATAGRTIRQEGVSLKSAQEALSWTLDMAFLFTLEAVATAAIRGQLPSGDEGDDEDGWLKFLAKQTAFSIMGTIPGVRDVASPLQGYDGGGAYGSITNDVAKPFVLAAKGEVSAAMVKSVINATGLATGLPATQINRAVDAAWRQSTGESVSPLEYMLGRIGHGR